MKNFESVPEKKRSIPHVRYMSEKKKKSAIAIKNPQLLKRIKTDESVVSSPPLRKL